MEKFIGKANAHGPLNKVNKIFELESNEVMRHLEKQCLLSILQNCSEINVGGLQR